MYPHARWRLPQFAFKIVGAAKSLAMAVFAIFPCAVVWSVQVFSNTHICKMSICNRQMSEKLTHLLRKMLNERNTKISFAFSQKGKVFSTNISISA